jgi:hypothetical protein
MVDREVVVVGVNEVLVKSNAFNMVVFVFGWMEEPTLRGVFVALPAWWPILAAEGEGRGADIICSVDSAEVDELSVRGAGVSTSVGTWGVSEVVMGAEAVTEASESGASLAAGSEAGAEGVLVTSWAEMAAIVSPLWESTTTVAGGPTIVWMEGLPSASVPYIRDKV